MKFHPAKLAILSLSLIFLSAAVFAQTTAFNFQGRLNDGANPANGRYGLQFKLFDSIAECRQLDKCSKCGDGAKFPLRRQKFRRHDASGISDNFVLKTLNLRKSAGETNDELSNDCICEFINSVIN